MFYIRNSHALFFFTQLFAMSVLQAVQASADLVQKLEGLKEPVCNAAEAAPATVAGTTRDFNADAVSIVSCS